MSSRTKCLVILSLACVLVVVSVLAFIGAQVCYTKSFWLHAMVFPVNPGTVAQPTGLTYLGTAFQVVFVVFLFAGVAMLGIGARSLWQCTHAGGRI